MLQKQGLDEDDEVLIHDLLRQEGSDILTKNHERVSEFTEQIKLQLLVLLRAAHMHDRQLQEIAHLV